jgi:hypothetical protein
VMPLHQIKGHTPGNGLLRCECLSRNKESLAERSIGIVFVRGTSLFAEDYESTKDSALPLNHDDKLSQRSCLKDSIDVARSSEFNLVRNLTHIKTVVISQETKVSKNAVCPRDTFDVSC